MGGRNYQNRSRKPRGRGKTAASTEPRSTHDRIPWSKVRNRYVTDETTTAYSLSIEFGCTSNVIANRAQAEQWGMLRRQHQQEQDEEVRKKSIELLALDLIGAKRELLHATSAIIRTGIERYHAELQAPEEMRQVEDSVEETEKLPSREADPSKPGDVPRGERILVRASVRKLRQPDLKLLMIAIETQTKLLTGSGGGSSVEKGTAAPQDDYRIG